MLITMAVIRTITILHESSGGAVISSYKYTYDRVDNKLTAADETGDITTWTYDAAGNLVIGRVPERDTGVSPRILGDEH